jgi:hypothetical protein
MENSADTDSMRDETQPPAQGRRRLGPFSGGQLTAIIIAVVIAVGFPVGAFAALTFTNVSITDPHGTYRATVNSHGQLEVHSSTLPGKTFSLTDSGSTGNFAVKLPACAVASCTYAVTDIVMSQTNTGVTRMTLALGFYADGGSGNCSTTGTELRSILPGEFLPADQITSIDFTTPIVASGKTVCLRFFTGANAGLIFGYTVSGYSQQA